MEKQKGGISTKTMVGIVILILALTGYGLGMLLTLFGPSRKSVSPEVYFQTDKEGVAVVYNTEKVMYRALEAAGTYYLPYTLVSQVDDFFYHDTTIGAMLYVKPTELLQIPIVQVSTMSEVASDVQVFTYGNEIYIQAELVTELSVADLQVFSEPKRLWLWDRWDEELQAVATKSDVKLRREASNRSDIVEKVKKGTQLYYLEAADGWACVMSEQGFVGWVQEKKLSRPAMVTKTVDKKGLEYTSISLGEPVVLVWHQVFASGVEGQTERFVEALEQTKGVNVVSPTWFSVSSTDGAITTIGDPEYVKAAHERGVQVWGLVDNFNDEVDNYPLLTSYQARTNLIANLMAEAERLDLDGINVDFEANETGLGGLNKACGIHFVQFIRELSIACRNAGIILSVDNYVPRSYNQYYHRDTQAKVADYIIVMGYDEHYGGSDAGSTSSLPFVEDGIVQTLTEVPKEKLINAVPFYTRLWKLTPEALAPEGAQIRNDGAAPFGAYALSSSAMGAKDISELLQGKDAVIRWLETEQQNYTEYMWEDCYYRLWMEGAASMEKRMEVMQKYDLAGVACWKLGLESPDMWDVISKYYP